MARRPALATLATAFVGTVLSTCGPTEAPLASESAGTQSVAAPAAFATEPLPAVSSLMQGPPAASASPAASEAPPAPPDASPCPQDMVLVQGEHCNLFEQDCLQWDDPEGQPRNRVCARFREPSTCVTRGHRMRFCIDRDEYRAQGQSLPVSNVSWEQSAELCSAQHKRLCRDDEWEFACEGEQGLPYPYGYERSPSLCNVDRLLRDGKFHASDDLREPPHATCVSPFGVRDMVGNVDEWVIRRFRKPNDRAELRGGWWMTGRNRCRSSTTSHNERYAGKQTGFRCCKGLDAAGPETAGATGEPASQD